MRNKHRCAKDGCISWAHQDSIYCGAHKSFFSRLMPVKKPKKKSPRQTNFSTMRDAIMYGKRADIRELIEIGVNINLIEGRDPGMSPLMLVADGGDENIDVLRLLLDGGADVNLRNENELTALMYAAHGGHVEIVKELLSRGADIHCEAVEGISALSSAVTGGHIEVVRLLLNSGARDNNGKTLERASKSNNLEIMYLLNDMGILAKGHESSIAKQLRCVYCGHIHRARKWPLRGDHEAVYFGKLISTSFNLKVTCPICMKDWYVYWYEDPGPIMPLVL